MQTLKTNYTVQTVSWKLIMNCVLCNPALQYLVCEAREEFAQPSITPPHKQYVITSVPRLCKWLQDSLSCNYFRAKLPAEAEKQVTGEIRALIVLVCNICLYDTLPPPAPPSQGKGRKEQLGRADPGPCAKIRHFSQIDSSLATTKSITVMLILLT